jgi:hypothetical protein
VVRNLVGCDASHDEAGHASIVPAADVRSIAMHKPPYDALAPHSVQSVIAPRQQGSREDPAPDASEARNVYQPPPPGGALAGADADGCVAGPTSGFFSGHPVRQTSDVANSDQQSSAFMREESHGARGLHKPTRHEPCSSTLHARPRPNHF